MDVETERVERTVTRSPKDKLLVDSGDNEENATLNGEKQPSGSPVKVTAAGDEDTNPADEDISEEYVLKVKQVKPTESVSSEIHLLAKSEPSYEDDTDVNEARETSASSSEPPTLTLASNEDIVTPHCDIRVQATVAASELQESSKPSKEEEVMSDSRNAAFMTPEFCATSESLNSDDDVKSAEVLPTSETDANDRLLLTDESTSEFVHSENKLHATGLSSGNSSHECSDHKSFKDSQVLGELVNGIPPFGMQRDVTQGSSDIEMSVSEDKKACKEVHFNAKDSLQPTLDNLDNIKEPEEPDHATECRLLHNDEETTETSPTAEDGGSPAADSKAEDDGWIYVLGHDKLKKRVIVKGVENSRPIRGQVIVINCVGHLEDGTEIDKHDNWSIVLGEDEFIHAFDLCLAIMDKGETCEVVSDSRFAYGELGREPDVPPSATISYIIELIDCHDHREYSTLTVAERIQLSNDKRERGNYLYSRNEYSRSIDSYTRALKALDEDFESRGDSPEDLQALIDTRIKCHNNMAAAQMKVSAWDVATKSCDVVLKVQPENVKALFRKGKCLANKGEVSSAIPLLKRALKLEPETKIIHQELSRLERKNKAQTESEKVLYQKMLGTDKEPVAKKKKESTSKWLWYVAGGAAAVLVSVGLTAYRYIHV